MAELTREQRDQWVEAWRAAGGYVGFGKRLMCEAEELPQIAALLAARTQPPAQPAAADSAQPDEIEQEARELCADLAALRGDLPPEAFRTRTEEREAEEKALIDEAVSERDARIAALEALLDKARDALIPLANAAFPIERELLTDEEHLAAVDAVGEIETALAQGKEAQA